MKTLLIIIATFIISTSTSDYCDGWKVGYEEGWCYEQLSTCLSPLTPLCPLPELNKNTYTDGYNRGFVTGLKDYKDQ